GVRWARRAISGPVRISWAARLSHPEAGGMLGIHERPSRPGRVMGHRSARAFVVAAALCLGLGAAAPARAVDVYVRAAADSGGPLRLERVKGKPIVVALDSAQVGFQSIAIARDGRSVGWLALYPNCCTSYPIPLELVIYSGGRRRAFQGSGLPI